MRTMNKSEQRKRLFWWDAYNERSLLFLNEGNKIIADVAKLLLGGGTFIFLISAYIFGQKITDLEPGMKKALICSWILIFISLALGIYHLWRESNFFGTRSSDYRHAANSMFSPLTYEDSKLAALKFVQSSSNKSDMSLFYLQVAYVAEAFLLQMLIISKALFIIK